MYIVRDYLYDNTLKLKLFKYEENAKQYIRNRHATIEEIEFVDGEEE